MSSEIEATVAALERLVARCVDAGLQRAEADPEAPSPCELGAPDADGQVAWQPVRRSEWDLLEPLAETLKARLHPSLGAYWGHYWSDGFRTLHAEGPVDLLGVWNADDEARLLQNLLGHALQQRRQRQPLTLFFACTEPDSDLILCVDNDTGAVLLEQPGTGSRRRIAPDLARFLDSLEPAAPPA